MNESPLKLSDAIKWPVGDLYPLRGLSSVYVVKAQNNLTKIGIAQNPYNRFSQYFTNNAAGVELVFSQRCSSESARLIEKACQKKLSNRVHHGEWYNMASNEVVSIVVDTLKEAKQLPILLMAGMHDKRSGTIGMYRYEASYLKAGIGFFYVNSDAVSANFVLFSKDSQERVGVILTDSIPEGSTQFGGYPELLNYVNENYRMAEWQG
jgi:hypothetical protein